MYGTQLKYDGSFKNVVKKSPIFWKKNVDIPKNIRKFIDDFSHNIILYDRDNDSYYCSCCLNKLEDFYTVIDKMTHSWLSNGKLEEYLRPITLFGDKFEEYLEGNWERNEVDWSSQYYDTVY